MGLLGNFLSKIKLKLSLGYYGYQAKSAPYNLDAWEHDTFRAAVDAIATHAAKGQAKHVVFDENGRITKTIWNSKIVRLLNEQPNEVMTGFDLKYRLVAQLESQTTAVCYLKWNEQGADVDAIYPVDYVNFEFREVIGGGFAIEFTDYEGAERILPLECCVVIRKFYNNRWAAGDGNAPIYKVLDMAKSSDEGFIEALTVSNKVRGLIKQKKAMLDPEDVKKGQQEFADRFAEAAKKGGIVGVDALEDYTQLNVTTFAANAAQMREINNRIYTYLRTPETIVQCKYSEQEGMAWHEGVIEPIWQMLAESITNVYFTKREKEVRNKIIISGGILMGTSIQTRLNVITNTKEIGLLSQNEQREILGYGPVEGGDVRLASLNFIDINKMSQYQTGQKPAIETQEGENNEPEGNATE